MLYRETGQFKTSYAADRAILPIRQDRIGLARDPPPRLRDRAAARRSLLARHHHAAVPDLLDGGARPQHPDRLCRSALARHRRLHGLRRVRGVQAGDRISGAAHRPGVRPRRADHRGRRHRCSASRSLRIKGFYLAVATLAAQFFLVWLFNKLPWFSNYSPSGVISAPPRAVFGDVFVTGAESSVEAKYLFALTIGRPAGAGRQEHDPLPDRPLLDGDPRHGHRRRDHRHPPALCQALGIRHQLILHRHRGRHVGLHLHERGRGAGVSDRPLVPDPVHDHHRRSRQHPGFVPGRGVHRHAADLPQPGAGHARLAPVDRSGSPISSP